MDSLNVCCAAPSGVVFLTSNAHCTSTLHKRFICRGTNGQSNRTQDGVKMPTCTSHHGVRGEKTEAGIYSPVKRSKLPLAYEIGL